MAFVFVNNVYWANDSFTSRIYLFILFSLEILPRPLNGKLTLPKTLAFKICVGYIVPKNPAFGINPHCYYLTLVFNISASARDSAAFAIYEIGLAGLRLV